MSVGGRYSDNDEDDNGDDDDELQCVDTGCTRDVCQRQMQ